MSRAVADVPTDHPAFTQPADPPPPASEVQTSAPVAEVDRDPVTLEPAKADAAVPPEPTAEATAEVDEGPYFRRKDGTFRKATKKEALGEMHSRINTLTGRLRGTEEELQRVKQAPQPPPAPTAPTGSSSANLDPNDPKPSLELFVNEADPYAAYIEAAGRWAAREERRTWERQQAVQQSAQKVAQTFNERAEAFKAEHPDYDERLKGTNLDLTPAMHHVLMTDEDGPAMAYYLAQHPDAGYQLVLDTMDVTSAGPKLDALRMLLKTRVAAAGSTGSARPVRSSAPVPLNPVRTGAPALDEPPLTGDVPFAEFVRRGNEADRKKREARFGA